MHMNENLRMLKNYCDFSDPSAVYILLMLPRKKENKNQLEREKLGRIIRYVVQNMDDAEEALKEFEQYATLYPEIVFRIYVSVNRRSLLKAALAFQHQLLEFNRGLVNNNQQVWTSIARLGSEFKSTLAKKENRFERRFFFDIDLSNSNPEDSKIVSAFVEEVGKITKIIYYGKSKNGFALVADPCDPNKLPKNEYITLKTDAYLYVDCLNDQGHD